MAREFRLPELAESVVEGEIIRWLVDEGAVVVDDQPLVEVMTDKVTVELPSPFAGVLLQQVAKEGDVVPVNAVIGLFADVGEGADLGARSGSGADGASDAGRTTSAAGNGDEGAASGGASALPNLQGHEERSIVESGAAGPVDDGSSLSLFTPGAEPPAEPFLRVQRGSAGIAAGVAAAPQTPASPAPRSPGVAPHAAAPAGRRDAAATPRGPYGRVLAVPAARKLARELNVAIEDVEGSGPNGRIRVEDVRHHDPRAARSAQPSSAPSDREREERIPLRGLRRAIATQMVASHLQAVRTLHVDEADATALVALRQRLKPLAEARGVRLSYLPFIMKAVTAALQAYPVVNASLDEAAGEIVRKHYYNLGMAVATDNGLVVPVIKDVEQRSILELADEINRLAAAARDGKLKPHEVKGGTFSITNIGSLGGLFSFPIINIPEAAILGVHSIKKRPVVLEDDSIVARQMLYLSLSFDHRLIDGAEGSLFTSEVIRLIETPEALMLDL